MATTIAMSSGQQGVVAQSGIGMKGIFTLTPGTTATAGEAITDELTPYFQSIDAIKVCGCSALALQKKIPVFQFTAGGALATNAVTIFWLEQDGAAGDLEPDDGTNLSAVGTLQIEVTGKAA